MRNYALTARKRASADLLLIVIALIVATLDQLTKAIIRQFLSLGQSLKIVDGILSFTYTSNTGVAFGFFKNLSFLALITTALTIAIILTYWWVAKPKNLWLQVSLGLILGGAVGNLIDRLFRHAVTDFIDFHFWPVFNIADSAVVIGGLSLLIHFYRWRPTSEISSS